MHTGRGIVEVTRQVLGESVSTAHTGSLQTLGNSVADSMLRKQCASCHIGQTKTEHRHDVMWDRGGGCLACHVDDYPENAHPALPDAYCVFRSKWLRPASEAISVRAVCTLVKELP